MGYGEIQASVYQLGRYKIIEAESGELRWNTCTHSARLKLGRGFIEGKILFINGKIIAESEFSTRKFFNQLKLLPKWEKTPYYCTNYTLKPCYRANVSSRNRYGRSFKEHFRYARNSTINDRKNYSKKAFKKIAEIMKFTSYMNYFFKRIRK
jgi:hypothetical protein